MKTTIKDIKKGTWFTKKDIENPTDMQVWIRGEYIKSEKKYEIQCWGDVNKLQYVKGSMEVYIDFTF